METKNDSIWNLLLKICKNISKESTDSLNVLCTALGLLREFMNVGEDVEVSGLPPRTQLMTPQELAITVQWGKPENEEKPHPIIQLESMIKVSYFFNQLYFFFILRG